MDNGIKTLERNGFKEIENYFFVGWKSRGTVVKYHLNRLSSLDKLKAVITAKQPAWLGASLGEACGFNKNVHIFVRAENF